MGATAHCGRNPSTRQQQTANGGMWLIKGPPNLMQRLSRLPSPPDVALLNRRQPKSFPWLHINTTFYGPDLYQMVLHRPIETTTLVRSLPVYFSSERPWRGMKNPN
jgi:hypothetical protein